MERNKSGRATRYFLAGEGSRDPREGWVVPPDQHSECVFSSRFSIGIGQLEQSGLQTTAVVRWGPRREVLLLIQAILWNLALPMLKPVLQTSSPAEDHAYRTLAFSMWHPQCLRQAWTQSWNPVKEHVTNKWREVSPWSGRVRDLEVNEGAPDWWEKQTWSDRGPKVLWLNPTQEHSDLTTGMLAMAGNEMVGKGPPQPGRTASSAGTWSAAGGRPATEV